MQIREQINCVQMEVERRELVMPELVLKGRITAERSALEIAKMKAVLETLINLDNGCVSG